MRIGIDLGGTKIEVIALGSAGVELARRRVPTPAGSFDATVQAITDLVGDIERTLDARGATIGVGTPGAVSPVTGLMKNANSVWLNERPLDTALAAALGRPVRLANDANCFALSEATDGAAADARVAFGAILGTGVGGGLVVGGRVLTGRNAIAGEWGHNPLPGMRDDERPGPRCYCGRLGCTETFLSGPGLERDHASHARRPAAAAEIDRRAAAGDADARGTLERYEDRLARALAAVINLLDPDVIVLGGGLSNVERLYVNVPARWTEYVFSDHVHTELRRAAHGDSSGVRGAAWLWPDTPDST